MIKYDLNNLIKIKDIRIISNTASKNLKEFKFCWNNTFYSRIVKYNEFTFIKKYETEQDVVEDEYSTLIFGSTAQKYRKPEGIYIEKSLQQIGLDKF